MTLKNKVERKHNKKFLGCDKARDKHNDPQKKLDIREIIRFKTPENEVFSGFVLGCN